MTSLNEKPKFFDADIVYQIDHADIRRFSSLFAYLVFVRPNYEVGENSRLTYDFWGGYFSALSDNLRDASDKSLNLKLYKDDYEFLCNVVANIDDESEKKEFERILHDMKKI